MTKIGGTQQKWHTLPERGSLWGIRFIMNLTGLLGERLIWAIIYPVLFYFFVTGKTARRGSRDYLKRVAQIDGAVHSSLWSQWNHFLHFAEALFDRLTLYRGRGDQFRLIWEGREIIDHWLDLKRGTLLVGAHLGSFELLRLLADERDRQKVHALMYTKQARIMNELLQSTSDRDDFSVIPLEQLGLETMLSMREIVNRGEHIGILADRPAASAEERVEWVDFLGEPAPFPVGPWQLASFLDTPVLLIFGVKTGRREYTIICESFEPVKNSRGRIDMRATIERYSRRLEEFCCRYPYQWFNFYDFWGGSLSKDSPNHA